MSEFIYNLIVAFLAGCVLASPGIAVLWSQNKVIVYMLKDLRKDRELAKHKRQVRIVVSVAILIIAACVAALIFLPLIK